MASVFFLHLPGNKDLLMAELELIPGEFKPSFMTPGFSTFIIDDKAKRSLTKKTPVLSLAYGYDAKRIDHEASVWVENSELIFSGANEFNFRDPKGNIWHGESPNFDKICKLVQITLPDSAPSRAYLKIAQAFHLFPRARQGMAIEIGSSPGGAAAFLLEQNLKLIGIDPGEMDQRILAHQNFKHIKTPVQDLTPKDLPYLFDLMAVDTNLPPAVSIKESLRVADWSKKNLKEIFMTIKLPNPRMLNSLQHYQRSFEAAGLDVTFIQLPSHHREVLLYGQRK